MAYEIIPFNEEHLRSIKLQPQQDGLGSLVDIWDDLDFSHMATLGYSVTISMNKKPVIAMGVQPIWVGRAICWFFGDTSLANASRRERVALMRCATEMAGPFFDEIQKEPEYRRIEATARLGFKQAHQFLRMLGFRREGFLRKYDLEGSDHAMYARIAA